jgi:hypothetical protein
MGETSYRLGATTKVSLSTNSAKTTGLNAAPGRGHRTFRLWSDVDCFIRTGSSPTAVADAPSTPLTAKIAEYVDLRSDEDVAGIVASSTGNLYVTVCTKG